MAANCALNGWFALAFEMEEWRVTKKKNFNNFLSPPWCHAIHCHSLFCRVSPTQNQPEENPQQRQQCPSSTFSSASIPFVTNMTNTTSTSSASKTPMATTPLLVSMQPSNPAFRRLSTFPSLPFPFLFLLLLFAFLRNSPSLLQCRNRRLLPRSPTGLFLRL